MGERENPRRTEKINPAAKLPLGVFSCRLKIPLDGAAAFS